MALCMNLWATHKFTFSWCASDSVVWWYCSLYMLMMQNLIGNIHTHTQHTLPSAQNNNYCYCGLGTAYRISVDEVQINNDVGGLMFNALQHKRWRTHAQGRARTAQYTMHVSRMNMCNTIQSNKCIYYTHWHISYVHTVTNRQ